MSSEKGRGQQKTHQVRNIATGEVTDVTQADWKDRTQYPRDQFERVDEEDDSLDGGTETSTGGTAGQPGEENA